MVEPKYSQCYSILEGMNKSVIDINSLANIINKGSSGKADYKLSQNDAVNFSETIIDDCTIVQDKITALKQVINKL